MRIDVVVPELGTGGAEAVVSVLARHHRAAGHDVTVHSSGGWRMPALQEAGVRWVEVPLRGRRPAAVAVAAWRIRRAGVCDADVVHAHNAKAAVAARAAVGFGRHRPWLVVTDHGFLARDQAHAARLLARTADLVVAVSEEAADRLREHGFPDERLTVIENAVEPPPAHDRTPARRRLRLPREERVALCLARMTVQKRHDVLLEAWRSWPDAPLLLLAGDGPTRPRVEALVARYGLRKRVRLLGDRRDADWLLAAADLLVLPSVMEGLPISVLEAMALRVPVAASAVGGLFPLGPEAVELVPPGAGPADWRAAVTRLLDDAERREGLVETGARLVAERFAPERMVASYDGLFARECRRAGRDDSAQRSLNDTDPCACPRVARAGAVVPSRGEKWSRADGTADSQPPAGPPSRGE